MTRAIATRLRQPEAPVVYRVRSLWRQYEAFVVRHFPPLVSLVPLAFARHGEAAACTRRLAALCHNSRFIVEEIRVGFDLEVWHRKLAQQRSPFVANPDAHLPTLVPPHRRRLVRSEAPRKLPVAAPLPALPHKRQPACQYVRPLQYLVHPAVLLETAPHPPTRRAAAWFRHFGCPKCASPG